ncbi:hypothetical protein T4B_9824 [Trichinella pseudospiralis]|uniref:Uncharacterized protein n=1 Tax=Trichinella pseudospiralis TaxID=6337 RepID=A0A0V1EPW4_TRIPS|nr:hypothetical protein T4A_7719 [Trichinella pseudospiralis]KRZ19504.1 hypothetical protein T4B_9824 [Trichinella pseudospiralis]
MSTRSSICIQFMSSRHYKNAPAHVAYPFRSLHSSKQSSIVEHVEEEERAKAPLTTTQESSRPVKWQSLANANANHYEQLTEEWSDMPSAGEFINLSKKVTDSIRYRFNIHNQDN